MEVLKKFKIYLQEVWGEVKHPDGKVSWPTKDEVRGSTYVVIVTVAIFGAYLALVDVVVGWVVSYALKIG